MSVIQRGKTSVDKGVDSFKESLLRSPEHFIQPTLHIDKLTRREYVNPDYVKRYGNPYNEVDKNSIYLEKSEEDISKKILGKEKREKSIQDVMLQTQELMYFYKEENLSESREVCKLCLAMNHKDNILCFNCSELMMISKYG